MSEQPNKEEMTEEEVKVREILRKIRPYLQADGGDVEFVAYHKGIVYVRLLGACIGCSAVDITLRDGIETILLEEVPGVIGVETVDE